MLRKGMLAHPVTIASGTLLGAVGVSGAVLVLTATGLRSAQQRQSEVFTVARQSTTDLLGSWPGPRPRSAPRSWNASTTPWINCQDPWMKIVKRRG